MLAIKPHRRQHKLVDEMSERVNMVAPFAIFALTLA